MSTYEFEQILKKNYQKLVLFTFLGGFTLALISSFFPKSFVAEGSFILLPIYSVSEKNTNNQYNYDGYYIDQITQSYSKTILGIIDTPEFKKKISDSLKIEANFINLFAFNLNTNFKETAPRILVLSVKENSSSAAENKFDIYSAEILNYANKYNTDKKFKLERLDNFIFTYENTRSIYFYSLIGAFIGFSCCLTFYYLKGAKK
jgi:hypothetical protein